MAPRLTPERLRALTLRRQFPSVRGRGTTAVVELYRRLGPVQTQVPRSAHLTVAGRLPGVTRDTVNAAFASYAIVKGTNLRGTVHSALPEHHALAAVASRRPRALLTANHLVLSRLTPADVDAEIERFCGDRWRERADVVEHLLAWLDEHEPTDGDKRRTTLGRSLGWGHPGLVRRPADERWETRTDTLHRTASAVVPQPEVDEDAAVAAMLRLHLAAYGPATRKDVAWWLGGGLRRVDAAVASLGDEVVRLEGTDGTAYVDLAEPPRGGHADPGLRLLSEFDGLLVGYAGPAHDRFLAARHLPEVWIRENGQLIAGVLHDQRVVATWRLVADRGGHRVEVTTLSGETRLADDLFDAPVAAVAAALGTTITDVRVS
ncbi:DNA glycosylase AlkZ-like family protein [Solicola sp. PLA-1-18]|uniref:DNA glycosylase AlkZ-like family protein n=1 Tax=Solicola sp. PLA-1-18 TaxID=3380532 RepID=UPI003B7F09FC